MFIPEFKFNLLSISSLLANKHFTVKFFPNNFVTQETSQERMVGNGERKGDLYILDTKNYELPTYVNKISFSTWHSRLGHLSHEKLCTLKDKIKCDAPNKSDLCYICPLAK